MIVVKVQRNALLLPTTGTMPTSRSLAEPSSPTQSTKRPNFCENAFTSVSIASLGRALTAAKAMAMG